MKPFAQQTYYELLEVPPTASDEDIRAAHQRLMELYSPDSVAVYALGDPEQVDALRERMTEAMEMLTDAQLRLEYDRSIGLPMERLAKAGSTPAAQDKADSAARVAEALATAAAALAKAAGAVDAERVEAESRLKAAASVNEEEAPQASATPGKSEERMRAEEPKRQEPSGKDASDAASEPVMVGGMAVVDAFRASFNQSLSFVYVPTGPLRGQGRANVASAVSAPVEEHRPAVEAVSPPNAGPGASASSEATAVPATAPVATETVTIAASPERAPEPAEEAATLTEDPAASPAASTTTVREEPPTAASAVAAPDAVTPPGEPGTATPPETVVASTSPAPSEPVSAPGGDTASASPVSGATAQGESDPNPTRAPTPAEAPPDASSTALARTTPATGASKTAVRPLTSRPIDSRSAANSRPGSGARGPIGPKLGDAQVLAQDSAIATAESALAQVAARVREARPRGVDIPADAEFNGELLRRVREARSLSIQQLADRTRISVRHLENVEADRYTALPPPVYLRGILMNLARELGLDPLRVSKSYLGLFSEKPPKSGR
ncbi:helix-turn-helix domain-containing protein [Corallococcus sicarius]|uniref:Molecular chaperone DnaJ n=1 Tax=Corallococcus sicarius TaxID=2316726 RepID=A0A3A8NL76_9BACT|nr:helix-turn-helix domain-containing protein [Corallococcus sicarius]RKH41925.1 molecular chaperone DnaJ [Corallococcus sicarius]